MASWNGRPWNLLTAKHDTEALSKQLFEFIFNNQSNVYQVEAANTTPNTPSTQVTTTQNNMPSNGLLDLYINIVSKPQKIIFYIFINKRLFLHSI
jgi:hypothetical protein